MATFVRMLLRHRLLASSLLALSLAVSIYAARTIALRFQYSDFYNYPGNRALPLFERDNELFGDQAGYVVLMVEADDVFRPDVLAYVERVTEALSPLPEFSRVRSLTNANMVRGAGDDVVSGPLLPRIPDSPEELAAIKQTALSSGLMRRRLLSEDAKTTAILADMRVPAVRATVAQQEQAVIAAKRVLAQRPPPAHVHVRVTGAPMIEIATTHALLDDQLLLTPIVCSVLGLMLFLSFRSLHGVLLCLASVGVALGWTAGLFALLGRPVDLMGSVIPITMLVYGVVDPVFVLSRFLNKVDLGHSKHDAIVEALSELALPCFLTSFTSSIGFAAFVTSVSPSVRHYGLTVAIGLLLAFVTTATVLPLLLSLAPLPKGRFANARLGKQLDAGLIWLGRQHAAHAPLLALAACLLLALGSFFAREQHVNNTYVGSLPQGEILDDVRRLEQQLAGVVRVVIHLEGAPGSMKRPEVLRAVARVEHALQQRSEVTYAASLADVVAEANQAFHGGDPSERTIPSSPLLTAQYLTLVDPADRRELVTDDYARSHLAFLLADRGSEYTRALGVELEQLLQTADFAGLGVKASVTGHGVVAYRELDTVVYELLFGFVVAFLAVIVVEWLTFRSVKLAALTIIPNLIPIAVCFLATRYLDIALRIDTILVLCVSIGGLFNTTIHFVARVRQQLLAGERDPDAVVSSALRTIGPPSLFTAVVLSVGFAVFVLSSFPGLQVLGLLSMITLLSGFVSDMLFTPALVRWLYFAPSPSPLLEHRPPLAGESP